MQVYHARLIYRHLPWALLLVGLGIYVGLGQLRTLHNLYYWLGIIPAIGLEISYHILNRMEKFQYEATRPAFYCSLIIAASSYFLPAILIVLFGVWIYLLPRVEYKARTISASLIGVLTVATIAAIPISLGWLPNTWAHAFTLDYVWALIPVGIYLIGRLILTIVRQNLRVH